MCTDVVEAAIRDCFLSYAGLPGAVVDQRDDFIAVRTGVSLPFFNGVPYAVLDGERARDRVRETLASFREKRVPFRWWITPSTAPADLIPILMEQGFRHVYDAPGMAADMTTLPAPQAIEGFEITRVEDADALWSWASILGTAFHRPEEEWQVWQRTYLDFGLARRWRHFIGTLDGVVVASSTVCIGDEIGGIYHVATLPGARGRGIGAAITLAAMHEARSEGCGVAALQSSQMAFGVYKAIGFRHCCDLTLYDWRPEYD